MTYSDLADPPIQPAEIDGVETAICPIHGGLLKYGRTLQDQVGKIYFCPVGAQVWRLSRMRNDVNQLPELNYSWMP